MMKKACLSTGFFILLRRMRYTISSVGDPDIAFAVDSDVMALAYVLSFDSVLPDCAEKTDMVSRSPTMRVPLVSFVVGIRSDERCGEVISPTLSCAVCVSIVILIASMFALDCCFAASARSFCASRATFASAAEGSEGAIAAR